MELELPSVRRLDRDLGIKSRSISVACNIPENVTTDLRATETLSEARSTRILRTDSVELMKDTHAPVDDEKKRRSASRRAGRPTGSSEPLARTELLSANLLSPYAAALARFYHAAGTVDRVRREALRDKRGRHSTPISPAARWNQVRVCVRGDVGCKGNTGATDHQAAATRAAREAGWTLETHLDELESTLEQQLSLEQEVIEREVTKLAASPLLPMPPAPKGLWS